MVKPKILVVDDDPNTINLFKELFRGKGADAQFAVDGAAARKRFREADYNLILMDQRLPDENGMDLLREMRNDRPQQVAIMITGYADVRDAVRAVREGLFDYLTKPFENLEELEAVIEKGLELDRAYREIDSLREALSGTKTGPIFIGRSPNVERMLEQVKQVAPLDTTVLLEGESGTGKDLIARIIHAQSPRAKRRFLEVDCGALPEQLLESTLFGYEKGAFTGAAKATAGYLEEADGGTLFLNEITDMSPKLQSSLLHVLQEYNLSRLGSTRTISSDFRLVCATNKRLTEEVKDGRFREDLFYRVNVVALSVPALRERREDIIPLAVHFLALFNAKFGKEVGPITPNAIRLMEQYPWPGNVRQLEHTIERIVALHDDGPISSVHLELIAEAERQQAPGSLGVQPYEVERQKFDREYVQRLLKTAGGNVTEAARLSGISRQNIYLRLKRLKTVIDS